MFHNQHESRGVHLSDYIESESDSGMKRFSLQGRADEQLHALCPFSMVQGNYNKAIFIFP